MKKILSIFALLLVAALSSVQGAPAWPGVIQHKQPDGTVVPIRVVGDEYCHAVYNLSGRLMMRDDDGMLRLATSAEEQVHIENERNAALLRAPIFGAGKSSSATLPCKGNVKCCVILVEFSDAAFSMSDPVAYYNRFLNQPSGFNDAGAAGSVQEYFVAMSGGKFTPQFEVYGPVRVSGARSAYSDYSKFRELVKSVTSSLDSQINFGNYDADSNGEIDNVYIISAGQGGNFAGTNSLIWPHSSEVTGLSYRDGKRLRHYAVCGEIGADGSTPAGMGTFVHEFSHVLGLPDHYNTSVGTTDYTPGNWDVMDQGCYLGYSGATPCAYSAYQRMALDWLQPAAVLTTTPASVLLTPLQEHQFAIKLETGRTNDYYLLENRQRSGWDKNLPGAGMLIWHIDATMNLATTPNNNQNHPGVELIRADNRGGSATEAADAWPGGNHRNFGATSDPTMASWQSSSSATKVTVTGRELSNISLNSATGHVTFDFNGGSDTNLISPIEITYDAIINVVASPTEGGKVSVGGNPNTTSLKASFGEQYMLYADPQAGYTFVEWRKDNVVVSTTRNFMITVTASTAGTYTAIFRRNGGGATDYCSPQGTLESRFGARYTSALKVTAGDTQTTIGPLQQSATAALYCDRSEQTVTVEAGGTFIVQPQGEVGQWRHSYFYIDWGGDGFHYNSPSDYVDPANGYKIKPGVDLVFYSNWCPNNAAPSASNPWYTSMDAFLYPSQTNNYDTSQPFTITIPADTHPGTYRARYKCHWQSLDPCGGADANQEDNNTLAHMGGVVADFTIKVVEEYVEPGPFEYAAKVSGGNGGLATVNGAFSAEVPGGQDVTFSAGSFDSAYKVGRWTAPDGTVVSTEPGFTIKSSRATAGTYIAHLEQRPLTLSVVSTPESGGAVAVNGEQSVEVSVGSRVEFTATPAEGYRFVKWITPYTQGGKAWEYDRPELVIAKLTAAYEGVYTAVFESEPVLITVESNPAEGGHASINSEAAASLLIGDVANFEATAAEGWHFVAWRLPDGSTMPEATFEVTVESGMSGLYVADFEPDPIEITVELSHEDGGIALVNGEPSVTLHHHDEAEFAATPTAGWDFTGWVLPDGSRREESEFTLIVDAAKAGTYLATFMEQPVSIEVSSRPEQGGSARVNGESSVEIRLGAWAQFEAVEAQGYRFIGWLLPNGSERDEAEFGFDVSREAAGHYVALFESIPDAITTLTVLPPETEILDMQGRRLRRVAVPGIYIVSGRKVVVSR